jgi:sugar/nucleoside kinase (ribokinase family)
MPRLLVVGHVTRDRRESELVLGGSAAYGALTARRLGWEAAVLTAAGPDFEPESELPDVAAFVRPSRVTTRFLNAYDDDGTRHQVVSGRADDIDLSPLPDAWRSPEALLLGPVVGEIRDFNATALAADCVGAIAQGFLREIAPDGRVLPREWQRPERDLVGVHVLFVSEHDLRGSGREAPEFLEWVPMVALTRGWRGLRLLTREATHEVPTLPRPEVDPTGAGDVFSAAFLVRYHEGGDPLEAAAFAACAASCAVEGVGTTSLGDRAEIERRLIERQRLLEEGEWDE